MHEYVRDAKLTAEPETITNINVKREYDESGANEYFKMLNNN